MASLRRFISALVFIGVATYCNAGPLGPLPNVTSADFGLKEGGCTVGDVVYGPGEEFPGAAACERCRCAGGAVSCARARCEPRPGCKALHRPDHCCPTYQCECEQEGRVYGNGEKLVDPQDPCRVCYCQGGEVVCRRIACFVRDDCSPRLVPGRCCPEYDNCPLRGVTTVPGVSPGVSTAEQIASSAAPAPPKENIKQEITIKEITPVSEIPIITDVKIKEILPSPGIEVPDYSSSKSPLIVREATSETIVTSNVDSRTEASVIVEVPSASPVAELSTSSEAPTKSSEASTEIKSTNDSPPSKISLSTQDSINSDIYPSLMTSVATMGVPSVIHDTAPAKLITKAPVIEEEDTLFDHNPAFPPQPDDLSVLSNHEDEIVPEQVVDNEHVPVVHETATTTTTTFTTSAPTTTQPVLRETSPVYVSKDSTESTSAPTVTSQDVSTTNAISTASPTSEVSTAKFQSSVGKEITNFKDSPMLNLRSAIPTEILNVPSSVPEEITGELDDISETTTVAADKLPLTVSENEVTLSEKTTKGPELIVEMTVSASSTATDAEVTTYRAPEIVVFPSSTQTAHEQATTAEVKSNIVTEITAQTEFSSLPIETSDQNPHENSEIIEKDKPVTTTSDPSSTELATTKISTPLESEIITVSRADPSGTDSQSFENIETTEFVLTPFGSSESATDAVELIKISVNPSQSAAIIEPAQPKKNNVLTDLINLVGDVASIGDHTDLPETPRAATAAPVAPADSTASASIGISDSEELIPVNAGYKSKNNNWNLNSITEVPSKKGSTGNKQKVVEIEDEEADGLTDSPPPNDKVEPTTRRPIIDNVSDDMRPGNNSDKKDIEIITKSYVPTINRRPTKVVMKKSNENPPTDVTSTDVATTMEDSVGGSEGTTATRGDVSTPRAPADTTTPAPAPTTSAPQH
ncbi:uncharacterized protein LOC126367578 isoform X2 [Pectinophora gossypiella]|nr:uncharacterized protein LOC126367578 isoform X2 [Pectinophora gossypiella]